MGAGVVENVFRRDRLVVAASLALLTIVSWAYLLWLADHMACMANMAAVSGSDLASPSVRPWTTEDFTAELVMWIVMMVGMMTPSAAPMILLHARVARQAAEQGTPLAGTASFAGGYLFSWTVFSFAATVLQWALHSAALLAPDASLASGRLGGAVLVVAGIYQWTSLKDACLQQCRAPLHFIQQYGGFQKTVAGAFRLGARHGLFCIGCCWALMALLFAGGVMNIAWVAAISIFVLVEKVAPAPRTIAVGSGVLLVAFGVWLMARG
jgi:predicted metal-binding membrane protein